MTVTKPGIYFPVLPYFSQLLLETGGRKDLGPWKAKGVREKRHTVGYKRNKYNLLLLMEIYV